MNASRLIALIFTLTGVGVLSAQETMPTFGVLLDTSPEMGFIIPQTRKEVRLVNEELRTLGRPEIKLREFKGASLGRESSLSVPGTKNALYAIRAFFTEDKVDTIYWITSLGGMQSVGGLFALENELKVEEESRPSRHLIIRNIWQEQLMVASGAMSRNNVIGFDPLSADERPQSWFRLVSDGRGIIMRSWQQPPEAFRDQYAFPRESYHGGWLRKGGYPSKRISFDTSWATNLHGRHQLIFLGEKEKWAHAYTAQDWVFWETLIPYPDENTNQSRDEAIFEAMSGRDSIEEDLAKIEAQKLGVLFSYGYVEQDLARYSHDPETRHSTGRFILDTIDLVREAREHQKHFGETATDDEKAKRVYRNQHVKLMQQHRRLEGPDPVAKAVAELVRNEKVDAVYLFTNGFTGGGRYGAPTIDENLLAFAIEEAGVKLYVRMPFSTGSTPVSLEQLAVASGGEVFRGKMGDDDWSFDYPKADWPGGVVEPE